MQSSARNGAAIEKLIVHDNEGLGSAAGLAGYLQRIDGGYHAIVDNVELVVCAGDDRIVWGAGGMNTHSLHICFIGYARWSRDEWLHALGPTTLDRAAQWLAGKCKAYSIPAVHLTPGQVATAAKGICTHGDVTAAGYTASEGHTDPGLGFPLDLLVAKTAALVHPGPPIDWAALAKLAEWQKRVEKKTLRYGQRGADVATLIKLLVVRGYLPKGTTGDRYGGPVWTAVNEFKKDHGWRRHTPSITGAWFGGAAAAAILRA